jgi:hypothetical protein
MPAAARLLLFPYTAMYTQYRLINFNALLSSVLKNPEKQKVKFLRCVLPDRRFQ